MAETRRYLQEHTNPPVFIISAILALAFLAWGVAAPRGLGSAAGAINSWITTYFGWWYVLSITAFVVFVLYVLVSPYRQIRLGKDDEKPEWGTWAWFSMLFTAGMGIGLVFYGVAEPISHFNNPPLGPAGTPLAAEHAMMSTFFHWCLHPWAVYIVVGMSMAYFCFRHDLPLRPASAFYPLIGDRIYGWLGNLIDILAVFGTLFGLATSLGLGAVQINAGLAQVFGIPTNAAWQVVIIAVVTAVAVTSVMLGIGAGIRRLSLFNMVIAILLAVIVFVAGPTLFILQFMLSSAGEYIQNLPETSLRIFTFSQKGSTWMGEWTLFYWGWWISWSPFVGMFIARISRGRTIGQFIAGALLAPTGASIVWFTIFGGSALKYLLDGGHQALKAAGTNDALFVLLKTLPLNEAFFAPLALLAILVVAIFFATSSDSGSLVVDMLTNGGDPHPIWQQRMFWAILEGVIAVVLLVAGATAGGNALIALQTASITSGLPFSVVLVLMCWGLLRALRREWELPSAHERMTAQRSGSAPAE